MRTLFTTGIQSPRHNFWMGQETAFVNTTPTETSTKETGVWDVVAQGLTAGADVYGSYGDIQEAEEGAAGKRAEAEAKAAAERTARIMQQTQAIQQETMSQRDKIAGVDKTVFFLGATLLGLATVGGLFYMFSKGK